MITAIEKAHAREVRRATELIVAARERVLEHLRLALELSRRMQGGTEAGPGRAYG